MHKINLLPKDYQFKIVYQYVYDQFIRNSDHNYIIDFSHTLDIDIITRQNKVEIAGIELTEELLSFILLDYDGYNEHGK